MTKFSELIGRLCTEEMMEDGSGLLTYYNGKAGYLSAYDAGLGFTWLSKEDDEHQYELGPEELELTPSYIEDIPRGTVVVATYGLNPAMGVPFQFKYEFGYYTEHGCVVYNQGERNMQDSHAFKLDQIRVASEQDMQKLFWGN